MALRERSLWKTVKPILSPAFLTYRIESSVTPGFPDVVLVHKKEGSVYFLELKQWKTTTRVPAYGGLSTSQRNWHTDVRHAGANNFVLAVDGNDVYWFGMPDGVNPIDWTIVADIYNLPAILQLRSKSND